MCPHVIALVVTYNRKDKLLACLDALRRQTSTCRVFVVDNASSDGTSELISPRLTATDAYYNTGANLGGAGGFSFGLEKALAASPDFIWIMDDDALPEPTALERLLAADRSLDGRYGWLSSRCLMRDGQPCPMNLQRRTPFSAVDGADPRLSAQEPFPAQMASFVSLFLKAETVRRVGLPFASFFIWSDDLEYTRRISRDQDGYVVPGSVVVHDIAGSAASNIALDRPERIARYFYAFRNEFFVYRREGLRGLAYYTAKVVLNLLRIVTKSRDHRRERLKALFSGLAAGLTFKPDRAPQSP